MLCYYANVTHCDKCNHVGSPTSCEKFKIAEMKDRMRPLGAFKLNKNVRKPELSPDGIGISAWSRNSNDIRSYIFYLERLYHAPLQVFKFDVDQFRSLALGDCDEMLDALYGKILFVDFSRPCAIDHQKMLKILQNFVSDMTARGSHVMFFLGKSIQFSLPNSTQI